MISIPEICQILLHSVDAQPQATRVNCPITVKILKKPQNIYLTTNMGKLFVVDIETGKTKSIIKIDSNQISRPFILNKNLFLIIEDAIIKLD